MPAENMVRHGIALSPEGRRILPHLTVAENLTLGAWCRKDEDGIARDMELVYNLFPRLRERSWQKGGTLSGGEQQMLAVGRALMSRPDLIMLDEPSLGLAPILVKEIFDIIRRINEDGKTVLLVEQNAYAALSIADYAYILEVGSVVLEGPGKDMLKKPQSPRRLPRRVERKAEKTEKAGKACGGNNSPRAPLFLPPGFAGSAGQRERGRLCPEPGRGRECRQKERLPTLWGPGRRQEPGRRA